MKTFQSGLRNGREAPKHLNSLQIQLGLCLLDHISRLRRAGPLTSIQMQHLLPYTKSDTAWIKHKGYTLGIGKMHADNRQTAERTVSSTAQGRPNLNLFFFSFFNQKKSGRGPRRPTVEWLLLAESLMRKYWLRYFWIERRKKCLAASSHFLSPTICW